LAERRKLMSIFRRERVWEEWIGCTFTPDGRSFHVALRHWGCGARFVVRNQETGHSVATEEVDPGLWLLHHWEGLWEKGMKFLHKVMEEQAERQEALSGPAKKWRDAHPALSEYLETDEWENGDARSTSTLLLFCDGGGFKACLNDRDANRSLWVTGVSFLDVLEALEGLLASGGGEWRANGPFKGKGRGRGKGKGA
jgi:hypothetical protein